MRRPVSDGRGPSELLVPSVLRGHCEQVVCGPEETSPELEHVYEMHPDLGLPASSTVRNKCLVPKAPSSWCFCSSSLS